LIVGNALRRSWRWWDYYSTLPWVVVLWRLLNGFTQLTGLQLEEIFQGAKKEPAPATPPPGA